jgi:hypothetical protein
MYRNRGNETSAEMTYIGIRGPSRTFAFSACCRRDHRRARTGEKGSGIPTAIYRIASQKTKASGVLGSTSRAFTSRPHGRVGDVQGSCSGSLQLGARLLVANVVGGKRLRLGKATERRQQDRTGEVISINAPTAWAASDVNTCLWLASGCSQRVVAGSFSSWLGWINSRSSSTVG